MPTKYRAAWAKLKKAIPTNDDEAALFRLMMEEEEHDRLAEAIVEKLAKPRGKVGAPRKTGGDGKLKGELLAKYNGNVKSARAEFLKIVCSRDGIDKKRARDRFKAAQPQIGEKDPKTGSGF
jgi:hypothetical protein